MNKIITISRQYASGGRTIGKMVAKELGIPLYDSEIIKDTMKKTGLSKEMVESAEQRSTNSFLFNLAMSVDETHNQMSRIEHAEHDVIKEYAKNGPSVIVGRSANFVLDPKDTLNVFVYSDMDDRISYAIKNYGIDEKQAHSMIKKTDHDRKMYASTFYNKDWESKNNYDLMLNSARLGIEKCVELIINVATERSR